MAPTLVRVALVACLAPAMVQADIEVGLGIGDITGPVADVQMMGMANPSQINEGLHFRLFSRAFVAHDTATDKRVAFASLDVGMGGAVVKNRVVAALQGLFPGEYSHENVCLSGTHTHSGPGGFLQNTMLQFAGGGFVPSTVAAFVNGTVAAIAAAHHAVQPVDVHVSVGQVLNASINRSPSAYLRNPAEERARYEYDTDKNMTLLKFAKKGAADGAGDLGLFNWFAVHPTSMNNTNLLVSGDNKGYASYLTERAFNGPTAAGACPGQQQPGGFVAAYASTNLGDVTPNILGPHCQDTGLPCDFNTSTCGGRNELCVAPGPGRDMFESCEIIASRQAAVAQQLYASAETNGTAIDTAAGHVDYRHMWVHMPGLVVNDPATGAPVGHLCNASMGQSFAAGTIDGPGMFDFEQGANSTNPLWPFIRDLLHKPSAEDMACQGPKDILLPTGNVNFPYPWADKVLPVQLLQLGSFYILAVPTEMTTMSGRRIRAAVKAALDAHTSGNGGDATVVLAGLSNAYADYTTTFEEYQAQRYEGGSTIYGPHQLQAYTQLATQLATAIATNATVPAGTPPPDYSGKVVKSKVGPVSEEPPSGAKMGDVIEDAGAGPFAAGAAVVSASFVGACPRNNLRLQGTFLEIQRLNDTAGSATTDDDDAAAANGTWVTHAVDGDVETRVHFVKKDAGLLHSTKYRNVTVAWAVPADAPAGSYRVVHYGTWFHEPFLGKGVYEEYTGTSQVFTVTAASAE